MCVCLFRFIMVRRCFAVLCNCDLEDGYRVEECRIMGAFTAGAVDVDLACLGNSTWKL